MAWPRYQRFLRLYMLGFVLLLAVSFVFAEARAIAHSEQKAIAHWIDGKDYEVATGPIEQLVLKDKFWKSDAVPTFVVGTTSFEYGIYSKNTMLRNCLERGPLQEDRLVEIWHHDGLILRVYAAKGDRK
ncbi:MAG: hypothetical protein R3C28_21175 [Pirellulaceae bacterium]